MQPIFYAMHLALWFLPAHLTDRDYADDSGFTDSELVDAKRQE